MGTVENITESYDYSKSNKDQAEYGKRYERMIQNRQPYNKQLYEKTGNPLQDKQRHSHNSPRTKSNQMEKNRPYFYKPYVQDKKFVPISDTDGLGSETWLNFRLDIDAVMSCLA